MRSTITLPKPPELSDYIWRPAQREDAEAIHQLLMDIEAVDRRQRIDTMDERQRDFDDPESNIDTDSLLAFTDDGQVAAMGWIFTPSLADKEYVSFLWGEVHPDHRQRGLGTFILTWMEARGRQIMSAKPMDLPHYLKVYSPEHLQDRLALFEQHGFEPVRNFYRMRRDLSLPIRDVNLPNGVVLEKWDDKYDQVALQALNEAFRDHWGNIPADEDHWRLWGPGHPDFRPDLTFLALEGGQVVGMCLNYVRSEENKVTGKNEVVIEELAVRRPWRNRGIATALLCASMRAFKRDDLEMAKLGVDTENTTGALRIYQRLGFAPVQRIISYSKSV